jgi:hypothetical protein
MYCQVEMTRFSQRIIPQAKGDQRNQQQSEASIGNENTPLKIMQSLVDPARDMKTSAYQRSSNSSGGTAKKGEQVT